MNLVDIVGNYVALKRAGDNYKGLCPFHEEKTPSFNVSSVKQIFKCFGCGAGGDVFKFVQLKEGVDFLEARRMLADRAGISLDQERSGQATSGPGKNDLIRVNEWAQSVYQRNYRDAAGAVARQYVQGRGISEESVGAFGLGLAVDSFDSLLRQAQQAKIDLQLLLSAGLIKARTNGGYYDTFRNRLMFPISDVNGRVIGFGGRTLGDDPAKYLNTPATLLFDKSANLFGLDRARRAISETGRVIVVEGYTDCIMAHQFGFSETVATLGTAMTEGHARLLRRFVERVILLFDSDSAGQRAADAALSVTLASGLDVSVTRVPEGKDPCDYLLSAGKIAFESVLNQGVAALEFKWKQLLNGFSGNSTGVGRRGAIEAYLQALSGWVTSGAIDPIQKGLILGQLSKILSMPMEDLYRQVQRMTRQAGTRLVPAVSSAGGGCIAVPSGVEQVNAEQRAYQQMAEVLLNDPTYYPQVREVLNPAAVQDPALRAVITELASLGESGETWRLDELIGRFEAEHFGRLITDLQLRGERLGNYSAVIEGSISCVRSSAEARRTATLAEEIRDQRRRVQDTDSRQPVPEGEDDRLAALSAAARSGHFSPVRARRKYMQ
ncbi:MAG: DNA primase [Phycisphaerales bacterium]|nr:DNA primase [Phycisphaerales bacterium]